MWYISGTQWVRENEGGKPKHYYTVRYAESEDGIVWKCSDHLCIPYEKRGVCHRTARSLQDTRWVSDVVYLSAAQTPIAWARRAQATA